MKNGDAGMDSSIDKISFGKTGEKRHHGLCARR